MNNEMPATHHIRALRLVWQEAFGESSEYLDTFFGTAFHPNRCRIALENDSPIAALYWFDCSMQGKPYAYLYAIATAASHKHQGVCHKLIEATHSELTSLGYYGALLVPGSPSLFDFYKTMGYETTCFIKEYTCNATVADIPMERITKEKFKELRKTYLPKLGILQEDANLDFLEEQATFYAGQNFLLTARKEKNILLGLELLGDTSLAPALAYSLGFQKGCFRSPGKEKPFAMYHSFSESVTEPPSYFCFAFD